MQKKDTLALYEITEELYALEEMLDSDQDSDPESRKELERLVENLLSKKTDNCIDYVQHQKDIIAAAKAKKKQLSELIKSRENRVNSFSEYVASCLKRTKKESFKGVLGEIKLRKPRIAVHIDDINRVPIDYIRTNVIIDKASLREDLKLGKEVDGVRLVEGNISVSFNLKSAGTV